MLGDGAGLSVGEGVVNLLGLFVGAWVGFDGRVVGIIVGMTVGLLVGVSPTTTGADVGGGLL